MFTGHSAIDASDTSRENGEHAPPSLAGKSLAGDANRKLRHRQTAENPKGARVARLADYIDTEGVGVVQQTGIPGKVSNRDQDVPWMLMVTFRISRRPTRSTTGTARPCKSHGIVTHARAAVTGICWHHHSLRKRTVLVARRCYR